MTAILEHPVLVLNRFWQPIHTCSVRRSLHLLCIGHAQVVQVEGDERFNSHDLSSWISYSVGNASDEMIHGARIAIRVPKIVVLSLYDRLPRLEVKFTRRNVFLRDKFTCQYCTKVLPETQLNLDHVTPRDKGGIGPIKVSGVFLHCNPRHHSLALFQIPAKGRMHHVMIEAVRCAMSAPPGNGRKS